MSARVPLVPPEVIDALDHYERQAQREDRERTAGLRAALWLLVFSIGGVMAFGLLLAWIFHSLQQGAG